MKELSIFVDESGDLGEYDFHAPYYIISMVLHDQSYDMQGELIALEESLSRVFNALLENVEFRKVLPADYRLFQVADLICTLKLTELKANVHTLSKSEKMFFGDERTLKKNYIKPLNQKEM